MPTETGISQAHRDIPFVDHNKIIAAVGKKILTPLGLHRDGKSRLWYDDHGWWAILVEFQPSAWGRGSYLNVGVSWMFYEASHWTFDIGYREDAFRPAMQEMQFDAAMHEVAAHAVRLVKDYRSRFSSLAAMYAHYLKLETRLGWPEYHAGILAGLSDQYAAAKTHFAAVMEQPCNFAWQHGLRSRCLELTRALDEPQLFRAMILGIIMRCRAARCLEEKRIEEIVFA